MKIRVLGCSGAIAAGYKTTAFLLDDDILIDAGTGVGDLPLEALARINHVLISHSHLDHILSIPLLADAVLRLREAAGRPAIQIHALPATLQALRQHIFNGVIWPDFTRLPSPERPVLSLHPFELGQRLRLVGADGNAREIEVITAAHTVPAVGFAVSGAVGNWVFTGDTGPNPLLWQRLAGM
ncbi:3',5'-cyclic-nucleotide phosphodiesterase, partial [Roseateles sp.]|uniref:3',5'-cyclic-nucleotide phosphodiesterase n=1 Tax=Roseateles sp. TaxID=1971397 RepID=UPI00286C37F5